MAETTQGNPSPQDGQGGDAPQYVTQEQLDRSINSAITNRFKAFESKQEKALEGFQTGFMGKVEELFKAHTPEPQTKPEEPKSIENHPIVQGLLKKQKELAEMLEAERKDKAEQAAKARAVTLRQTVSDTLAQAGIPADRIKYAVGHLLDVDKRVAYGDEPDTITFKDADGTELDLNTGIKSWLKSDDAKIFLPARNLSGSGARQVAGPQTPNQPRGQVSPEELRRLVEEARANGEL